LTKPSKRVGAHEGDGNYSADSESQRAKLGEYKVGETYACWYDPGAPENVILTRSWHLAFWLTISVCSSLVLIGGGGLIYTVLQTGTSIERRSAMARKATDMELLGESPPSTKDLPGIPTDADMTNSPGTTLAFRLPVETTPGQSLLAALIFCLVWNVLMVVFVAAATIKHLQGRPDWLLTVVTIPTTGIGIWSIYYSFRRILMASGIGPTSLEISAHPLLPGKTYDLFLVQTWQTHDSQLAVAIGLRRRSDLPAGNECSHRVGSCTR
jgi:hypothetical protein